MTKRKRRKSCRRKGCIRKGTRLERLMDCVTVSAQEGSCWTWEGAPDKGGYGQIIIEGRSYRVHRLSYELFKGDPGELFVCHSCDVPSCVNPEHLFLGTHKDNMEDMKRKNRQAKGTSISGTAKLNKERVLEIRSLWEEKGVLRHGGGHKANEEEHSYASIARLYGISYQQVQRVVTREAWKHI